MKYFLGLSSTYSFGQTIGHTFAFGSEMDLSELRAYLAAHYGATYDHVGIYSNGRSALTMAVKAVAKRGSKVVVTSLTCYAVVQAVRAAGCVPVFADIDPEKLHYGKKELEALLQAEKNVQAMIIQNNLGIPVDIVGIEEVAKANKISIIEDLAHCVGVKYSDGREAGTVGRATVLSFGKGKSIDTITGGAVVLTNPLDSPIIQPEKKPKKSDSIRARFYPVIAAFIRGSYKISNKFGRILTGINVKTHLIKRSADDDVDLHTRLTYWQCKLALRQLQAIPHNGVKPIRDHFFVNDRESVLYELERNGFIFHDVWYETPVAPERYFEYADFHPESCPVATRISTQIINVPTWYHRDDLAPALKIIRKDLVNEDAISIEETLSEDAKKQVSESLKIEKKRRREKRKINKKKNPRNRFYKIAENGSSANQSDDEVNEKQEEGEDGTLFGKSDLFSDNPGMIVSTGNTRQNKTAKDKIKKAALASSKKGKELKKSVLQKAGKAMEKATEQRAKQQKEKAKSKVKSLQERRVESLVDLDEKERLNRENGDSWWLEDGEERKVKLYQNNQAKDNYYTQLKQEKNFAFAKKEIRSEKTEIDPLTGMKVASRKISEREKIIEERKGGHYNGGSNSVI